MGCGAVKEPPPPMRVGQRLERKKSKTKRKAKKKRTAPPPKKEVEFASIELEAKPGAVAVAEAVVGNENGLNYTVSFLDAVDPVPDVNRSTSFSGWGLSRMEAGELSSQSMSRLTSQRMRVMVLPPDSKSNLARLAASFQTEKP